MSDYKLSELIIMICYTKVFLLSAFLFLSSFSMAEIILPHIVGDNMVLQRDISVPLWGWAAPDEKISVRFNENEPLTAITGKNGRWEIRLPAQKAGGPHKITISGSDSTVTLNNVMTGEVWLCAGQANMDRSVEYEANGRDAINDAKYPDIRFFQVPVSRSGLPAQDVQAAWAVCAPERSVAGNFSAVGYFFGVELYKELGVPIGLIQTSTPSSRADAWMPAEAFAKNPEFKMIYDRIKKADSDYRKALEKQMKSIELWLNSTKEALATDNAVILPPPIPVHQLEMQNYPTSLFNGMINPLIPFGIRGVIWYQGESNRNNGFKYYDHMKALITGWRTAWQQGSFPFYYVQIAPFNFGEQPYLLPELWEAQRMLLYTVPNTGMAVINDCGSTKDPYTRNKVQTGKRLALIAFARTYGKTDKVHSGPLYKSMSVENGKIRVAFDHVGTGLKTRDDKAPTCFEIAGSDKNFVKASAKIENSTVIVWNDSVKFPAAVRFAWHQEAEPNLINKEWLPAVPFNSETQCPEQSAQKTPRNPVQN